MLAIAGLELACTGFVVLVETSPHQQGGQPMSVFRTNAGVALLTAAVILGLKKTHYGALAGLAAHIIYGSGLDDWMRSWTRETARESYEHVLQVASEDPSDEPDDDASDIHML